MVASREEMLPKLHAHDEFYRRRARRSFAEFPHYAQPGYQPSWFHEELARELDRLLSDVLSLRSPRQIVNVSPQEGKSEQVSRRFPAYAPGPRSQPAGGDVFLFGYLGVAILKRRAADHGRA